MKIKLLVVIGFSLSIAAYAFGQTLVLRVGAFPNITHPQAMIGKANGWFEKAMGPNVKIDWKSFNAGPSAIEALFAGAHRHDVCRSQSHHQRLCALPGRSAQSGFGSGQRRCIPGSSQQRGNQQAGRLSWQEGSLAAVGQHAGRCPACVVESARHEAHRQGRRCAGNAHGQSRSAHAVLKQQLDAAWAPEPWATRLIREGNGRLFLDERDLWPNHQFVITNLIVSQKFLREHPDVVKNWIRANLELTEWINGHLPEAKKILNAQIQKETGKALPPAIIDEAFSRMDVTYDPIRSSLLTSAQSAFDAGFLGRQMPDLSGLYDLSLLNQVLAEKRKKAIQ